MKEVVLILIAMLANVPTAFADWPSLPFPDSSIVESIGDQVRLNGMQMKMYQIHSNKNVKALTDFYQNALGEKYAKKELENGIVLSQKKDHYFITIRITPTSKVTSEVLLSIGDMKTAKDNANRPLGYNLPRGSQILSDMESSDEGKLSRQLVYVNRHSVQVNEQVITKELQKKGYQMQPMKLKSEKEAKVLNFEGKHKEANAVIVYNKGYSSVVLTTVQMP